MNKKIIISAIVAAIVIPFGVYTLSPLFINTTIDRKKLESNNLDDDSLYFLYLIAKSHNDRLKSKKHQVMVV